MQDECIAVALGLPQLKILWQQELEDHFGVTVIYRRDEVTCPRRGMVTTKERKETASTSNIGKSYESGNLRQSQH